MRAMRRHDVRAASYAAAQPPPTDTSHPKATEDCLSDAIPTRVKPATKRSGVTRWMVATVAAMLCMWVTVAMCTPVLTGSWHITWAVLGVVACAVLVMVAYTWTPPASRARNITLAVVAGLSVCFFTGVFTNPVIVDGAVQANTSATAAQVRYITDMRDDLYTLRELDKKLSASDAAAWASPAQFDEGKTQVQDIGRKYRDVLESASPPAGVLADPTRRTLSAAHTLTLAYDNKIALLRNDDTKLRADLNAHRGAFATALVQAGASLSEALNTLDYDITLTAPQGASS